MKGITMNLDMIKEIITILTCYRNNLELASTHKVPKKFYADSIRNLIVQLEAFSNLMNKRN